MKTKPKENKSRSKNAVENSTTFMELMGKHPEAAEILMNKGMHCVGCSMAAGETIEQGAIMHGLNPDKLVGEINKKLEKKASKSKTKNRKNKK